MNKISKKAADLLIMWFVMPILMYTCIKLLLDPNYFAGSKGTTSKVYRYTGNRVLGGFAGLGSVFLLISGFVKDKSARNAAYEKFLKVYIPCILLICFVSALFSVITGLCWGLYESRYIDDPAKMAGEYFWLFFSSTVGPYIYYFIFLKE